jgi:DNA repair protein RadC
VTNPLLIPRYTLQLVPGSARPDPPVVIRDSAGAATILRPLYQGLDREQFLVACLDAKHAVIGVNIVSVGSLTLSIVHPREVFKPAILLPGIRNPVRKIVCSLPGSVRPAISSASPFLTTLF